MRRKREERRLCKTTLTNTEVLQSYYTLLPLQVVRSRAGRNGKIKVPRGRLKFAKQNLRATDPFHEQEDIRRCVACSVLVDNENLGGRSRKSALAGPLWCYHCAD